jgi:CheY-like chemotaxis protein
MSILLVEDNILNQRLMSIYLGGLGHKVIIANHGVEGVEMYKSQIFDLILMDIMMPVMDGFEATKEIREIEKQETNRPYTPIIAFTANTLNNDYHTCISKGMDHLLEKPFSVSKFHEILDELE